MTIGIYAISHGASGRTYIGSSVKIERRWSSHKGELRRGVHRNIKLQRAWNKYGEIGFEFTIVEIIHDRSTLFDRETHHIQVYSSADDESGFNLAPVGGSIAGYKMPPKSDEERSKISKRMMGHPVSEECRQKIRAALVGRKGSPRSAESVLKVVAAHIGKKRSLASRENMRAAAKGRKMPARTPATIEKMKAGMRAAWADPKIREKRIAAMQGVKKQKA